MRQEVKEDYPQLPLTSYSSLLDSISCGFGNVGENFDRLRIAPPYFQKIIGIGTRAAATQPRRVPAHCTPMPSNI